MKRVIGEFPIVFWHLRLQPAKPQAQLAWSVWAGRLIMLETRAEARNRSRARTTPWAASQWQFGARKGYPRAVSESARLGSGCSFD